MLRRILLLCGILSSALYVLANIVVPMHWDAYDWVSQTVSELSAVGAPTRRLWMSLLIPYGLLLVAFGAGVRASSDGDRRLAIAGTLIIIAGIVGFTWPPMHPRDVLAAGGGTFTDTMHIVFTAVNALLLFAAIGFSMTAFGKPYRIYCIVTVVVELAFGIVTGIQSADMQQNLPTPFMGVYERIVIAAMMAWPVVLAVALARRPRTGLRTSAPLHLPA